MSNMETALFEWLKERIGSVFDKLTDWFTKDGYPLIMTISQTEEFLGISYDLLQQYKRLEDFPKQLPGKKYSKLAIIEWLKKQ